MSQLFDALKRNRGLLPSETSVQRCLESTQPEASGLKCPLMAEIDNLLREDRSFPPSTEWKTSAIVSDASVYERAAADPEAFWAAFARELDWIQPWTEVV